VCCTNTIDCSVGEAGVRKAEETEVLKGREGVDRSEKERGSREK
jgi:hypothetical protein